jgi:hypothetical protein
MTFLRTTQPPAPKARENEKRITDAQRRARIAAAAKRVFNDHPVMFAELAKR